MQLSVLLVGVIVAFIYAGQLYEMRKSTQAATDAIRLARESSNLDQRAWVAIAGIELFPEVDKPLKVTVKITNTGKTFARNLKMVQIGMSAADNIIPNFEREIERVTSHYTTNDIVSNILLAPNATTTNTLTAIKEGEPKLTQEWIEGLKSGKYRLFVFGRIEYDDIFECPHWTRFCSFLQYREISGGWNYMSYKEYNDADNNRCLGTGGGVKP